LEDLEKEFLESDPMKKFRSWYKAGHTLMSFYRGGNMLSVSEADRRNSIRTKKPKIPDAELRFRQNNRFEKRMVFLTDRKDAVVKCTDVAKGLVEKHNLALEKGFNEETLLYQRAILSNDDLKLIMSSLKFLELSVAHGLVVSTSQPPPMHLWGSGKFTEEAIACADIFTHCNIDIMTPSEPPEFERACLPGTDRRPLKPWQLCSPDEKFMEVTLACTLDNIMELAFLDGVCVPDPEDITLDPHTFDVRRHRWNDFTAWYAGNEEIERVPGRGVPTLARVIFSEDWETKVARTDPFVLSRMEELGFPQAKTEFPDDDDDSSQRSEISPVESSESLVEMERKREATRKRHSQIVRKRRKIEEEEKDLMPLIVVYEGRLPLKVGCQLRMEIMRRYIDVIMRDRYFSMMQLMCPPGMLRAGHQVMLPPVGMLAPKMEFPPKRIKMFPSRSREVYTLEEILAWYSEEDFEDERLMQVYTYTCE
jgi:hypothetical protein